MKKTDVIIAVVVGELVAWYFVLLFGDLTPKVVWFLPVVFPILSPFCLWLAYLIGKKFLFIFQGAKFLLMGALASLVDFGILNFLILISGVASGLFYSVFKGISFVLATCGKYAGDKLWAFRKREMNEISKEFFKFFLVTLGGLVINVIVASLVVNKIGPQFGLSETIWANIGAIAAALATVAWNFPGYKFLVFKK